MSEVINLTSIKTLAGNKEVKPDADGYYRVTVGAFNVRNAAGAVYLFNGVKEHVNAPNTVFNRRIIAGRLRAESEHPKHSPGETDNEFILRNLAIATSNSCAHIKEIFFLETNKSEGIPGVGNIVLVEALIRPSGVHGEGLKSSLDNPHEDTCFSIRCFTRDTLKGVTTFKKMLQLVTWDWITEPGIKYASKIGRPSVESETLLSFDLDDIDINGLSTATSVLSSESNDVSISLDELRVSCEQGDIVSSWVD